MLKVWYCIHTEWESRDTTLILELRCLKEFLNAMDQSVTWFVVRGQCLRYSGVRFANVVLNTMCFLAHLHSNELLVDIMCNTFVYNLIMNVLLKIHHYNIIKHYCVHYCMEFSLGQ